MFWEVLEASTYVWKTLERCKMLYNVMASYRIFFKELKGFRTLPKALDRSGKFQKEASTKIWNTFKLL